MLTDVYIKIDGDGEALSKLSGGHPGVKKLIIGDCFMELDR